MRTVDTGLAIAVQRFNEGLTALLDMMLELELMVGPILEEFAGKEDTASAFLHQKKLHQREREEEKD